jgi:hypothetical protein
MRSLIKTQILVFIVIITLLTLSYFAMAERNLQFEQEEERIDTLQTPINSGSRPIPVPFYLLQGFELTPELPKEGKSTSIAACPNGFVANQWSLFGFFGTTEWRDVGTWSTEEVMKPLQAMGNVKFRLWFTFTGSGSPTGRFNFFWQRKSENIAEVYDYSIRFESGMQPRMVEVEAPLINQTPFQISDVFSLYIQCRNNFDGAKILYGSREHSSAVVMNCNPIEIIELKACKKEIKVVYDDIFQVKPSVMTFIARVDNIEVDSVAVIGNVQRTDRAYRSATWSTKIEPGSHEIEVSISYLGGDNVSVSKQIKIKKVEEPNIFGIPLWIFHIIVGLIILAVIAVISIKVYNRYQEQQWLESKQLK